MTLAAKKMQAYGASKHDFEKAIEGMSEQIRRMDHLLAVRVEHQIAAGYQNQQNELRYIHMMIERMNDTL